MQTKIKARPAVAGSKAASAKPSILTPKITSADNQKRNPRPVRKALLVKVDTSEVKALKLLTARVLGELKNPAGVPSAIILKALQEARTIR